MGVYKLPTPRFIIHQFCIWKFSEARSVFFYHFLNLQDMIICQQLRLLYQRKPFINAAA